MNYFRPAAVAGYFYPRNPIELSNQIDSFLKEANPDFKADKTIGLVSPHAGYVYSGKTAAYGFNQLLNKDIENVIIISPSHREYFPGISVYDGDGYETPLGKVKINQKIADSLINGSKLIFRGIQGHRMEHAVEVQIPFLQKILKNFNIVPVVMGDQGKIFVDELSERLADIADEKTIIIASSDMSHFYDAETANKLDSVVENHINNFTYEELHHDLETKKCEACGGGPIVVLMKTADLLSKQKARVLHRSDSGDVTGDKSEVVGYLSAVVYGD